MKIVMVGSDVAALKFGDLKTGDCFKLSEYPDLVYMKLGTDSKFTYCFESYRSNRDELPLTAVNLTSGLPASIDDNRTVRLLNATLTVQE